jgi:hypothetical protein
MPRLTVARALALLWLLLAVAILLPYGLGGLRKDTGGYGGSIGVSVEPVEFKSTPLKLEVAPRIIVDIEPKHEGITIVDPFVNTGEPEFEFLFRPWLNQNTYLAEFQLTVKIWDSTIHSSTSYISGGYYIIEAVFTPDVSSTYAFLTLKAPLYTIDVYQVQLTGLNPGTMYRVTFKVPYQQSSTHYWEGQTITARFTPMPPLRLNTNFYQASRPFEIWAVIIKSDGSSVLNVTTITSSMPSKSDTSVSIYLKITLTQSVTSVGEIIVLARPHPDYSNALTMDMIAYPVFSVTFGNAVDLDVGFYIEVTYTLQASP